MAWRFDVQRTWSRRAHILRRFHWAARAASSDEGDEGKARRLHDAERCRPHALMAADLRCPPSMYEKLAYPGVTCAATRSHRFEKSRNLFSLSPH